MIDAAMTEQLTDAQLPQTETPTSAPITIRRRRWPKWLWRTALVLLALPILQVATLRFIDPPVSAMMVFRMFDHLFAGDRIIWSHTNMSKGEISPYL